MINKLRADHIKLFPKPTPLQPLNRISNDLDIKLYIKRDDLTAAGGGGNKARKLEYILASLDEDIDTVVTVGSVQSNHARTLAAVAKSMGLECHLILISEDGNPPDIVEGNCLLETILGVDVTYTTSDAAGNQIDSTLDKLSSQGHTPAFIEGGGHNVRGALGYIDCYEEIMDQIPSTTIDFVITPTGTGTTQAGLLAGNQLHGSQSEIIGISIARVENRCKLEVNQVLKELSEEDNTIGSQPVTVYDDYIGEDGYGTLTARTLDGIRLLARQEGIFLDPVYTGKAFGGLLDLVERDVIPINSVIVFVHTGGIPGLHCSTYQREEIWTE